MFDGDRYWQITTDYAKAAPDDVLVRIAPAQRRARIQPNSTSYQHPGSATDGRGMSAIFQSCDSRSFQQERTRSSSPRTRSSADGSLSLALIPRAGRRRFCFATTRRTSRKSLVQPGDALDCARKIRRRDFGGFLARFRFAAWFPDDVVAWRLSHEESPCGVRLAPSVP